MLLPLLNAIYSSFTATGALTTSFPGGLHRDQAPEGTAMPYLVSRVVSSKLNYAYAGPSRFDVRITFSAYGQGHDLVGTAIDALIAAFDDALLSLSSGTNDAVTRLDEPTPKLLKHDGFGNDIWEWSVSYDYSVKV